MPPTNVNAPSTREADLAALVELLDNGQAVEELDVAVKDAAFPGTDRFGSRFALFLLGTGNSVFGRAVAQSRAPTPF